MIATATQTVIDQFVQEAGLAGAIVHGPVPVSEALAVVRSIVEASGGRGVMAWTPEALGVPDAWSSLAQMNIEVVSSELPPDRAARLEALARLDHVTVGLTGVAGALADTGTLVMSSGAGRPRLAWLLPPQHVALVPTDAIVPDMASFFADGARITPDAVAHLAFVTGPSRSGDIELTLTRGVHGPKAVHVVLIQP